MNPETKDYMDDVAERIVTHYNKSIPVDVRSLVANLGGVVVEKEAFDDLCDCSAMKTGDSQFAIFVAKHQDKSRKERAIARSLGHVILHMGFMTDPDRWGQQAIDIPCRFDSFTQNLQAANFAMALLMPKTEYMRVITDNTENNIVDMDNVARYFNVSIYDAIGRGRSLEILQFLSH